MEVTSLCPLPPTRVLLLALEEREGDVETETERGIEMRPCFFEDGGRGLSQGVKGGF